MIWQLFFVGEISRLINCFLKLKFTAYFPTWDLKLTWKDSGYTKLTTQKKDPVKDCWRGAQLRICWGGPILWEQASQTWGREYACFEKWQISRTQTLRFSFTYQRWKIVIAHYLTNDYQVVQARWRMGS